MLKNHQPNVCSSRQTLLQKRAQRAKLKQKHCPKEKRSHYFKDKNSSPIFLGDMLYQNKHHKILFIFIHYCILETQDKITMPWVPLLNVIICSTQTKHLQDIIALTMSLKNHHHPTWIISNFAKFHLPVSVGYFNNQSE